MEKKIMNIWSPVTSERTGDEILTKVLGRSFVAGKRSFIERLTSLGEDILASPVRLVGVENGKELVTDDFRPFVCETDEDGKKSRVLSSAQSSLFIVNTSITTEFDGFMDVRMSIMPRGRSVKQCFGLEPISDDPKALEKLCIEFPIRKEVAKFYHFYPDSPFTLDGVRIGDDGTGKGNSVDQGGSITGHLELPFKEQVYIANDRIGVGVFFESDRYFELENADKCIEIFEEADSVVLRYHLLDREPQGWLEKGDAGGMDLYPITFGFGIEATPTRPYPSDPYREHAVHIDCYKKIPEDYEEYLFKKYGDEIMIDRLARLGINTLYLHEKWNDIQNSTILTSKTEDRLRLIVSEAHKRGIKVIPYFGYEISTLSPYFAELGEETMYRQSEKNYAWSWYRQPPQRALGVCYASRYSEIFANGIEKLMDRFGFDGIYLDTLTRPKGCANEKHGCGYRTPDGALHVTYPVIATRNLMKRLYEIVDSRGGRINVHSCGSFNIPALTFAHSAWEGETLQTRLMLGEVENIPNGHMRGVFTGRTIGLPVHMLCYQNENIWTFENAFSQALIYGILPKSCDAEEPLELMGKVWRITDSFGFDDAEWLPYYSESCPFVSSRDNIKVSCYRRRSDADGAEMLVFCANERRTTEKGVKIELDGAEYEIVDSLGCSADEISSHSFDFDGMTYKIFTAKTRH